MKYGLLICVSLLPLPVWGQAGPDTITLLKKEDGSRTRMACTVLDHTGEFIRYRLRKNGPITVKPSSQVVSIETSQTLAHINALQKFADGETKQAIELFETALKQEARDWVRRDILAMLVKAALVQNNYAQAGQRFLLIYADDSTTHHFRGIPLRWTTAAPSASLKALALQWMTRDDPVEKLLSASALLFDPKYQNSAKVDLQRLRVHRDPRIRYLAITQLWRLELPARKLQDFTLTNWEDTIRAMPQELRGGPYFVVGESRRQRQEYDLAAMSLLWLPLVYDHDYQLSSQACLNAADSLLAISQKEEARALYHEVATRYRQSSYAQDAVQALKMMSEESPNSPSNP